MALQATFKPKYEEMEEHPESTPRDAFEKLAALFEPQMRLVNQLITQHIQGSIPLITELSAHLIGAGGKRLRPLLTLASAALCSRQEKNHLALAACVEFIHSATLLHDDVVDESFTRRGQPSANAIWGSKPSILVGDFLFSRAFELMVSLGSLEVLEILSRTAAAITQGEIHQLCLINEIGISQETYLEIAQKKTSSLFGAACSASGMLAQETPEVIEALFSYGYNLGLVFQLTDDILDYVGDNDSLGKDTGDDFREGKATLPVLLAYKEGSPEERSFWKRTISQLEQEPEDLPHALSLMKSHNAFERTWAIAKEYGDKAVEALQIFPESASKTALAQMVDFCLNRGF
jgi:octaprenyl-diphosphate synthase